MKFQTALKLKGDNLLIRGDQTDCIEPEGTQYKDNNSLAIHVMKQRHNAMVAHVLDVVAKTWFGVARGTTVLYISPPSCCPVTRTPGNHVINGQVYSSACYTLDIYRLTEQ